MVWDRQNIGLAALGGAAAVALAVEGVLFFSGGSPAVRPRPVAESTPAPAPTRQGPLTSPFTGERVTALNRVLVVKIGNTYPERPATGLSRADIVYLIPVEGGLSRIIAVFS